MSKAFLGSIFTSMIAISAACFGGGGDGPPFPDLQPFPPDLEAQLHDIRDGVAELRGLAAEEQIDEGQISAAELVAYTDEAFAQIDDDDREELDAFAKAMRLMHLIGPDDDLLEIFAYQSSEAVLGFYNFEERTLVLVADNATALDGEDELVLAHEYVHSFQDLAFDSQRLAKLAEDEDEDAATEYGTTVSCLKEGDATLAMYHYGEAVYGPDWYGQTFGASVEAEDEAEDPTPPGLARYFAFDYLECVRFAMAVHAQRGWQGIDGAYDEPPWTTEQILHPDKYFSRESSRTAVPASIAGSLGDGWSRLDASPFGEFDVYNYLATIIENEAVAAFAAAGWGGGWLSVYATGPEDGVDTGIVVHLRLDWDTANDLGEFLLAYGGVVERVSGGDWDGDARVGPVTWRGDVEFGYASWDERLNRIDIVFASDEAARDAAAALY